jgi:hypothetical protein
VALLLKTLILTTLLLEALPLTMFLLKVRSLPALFACSVSALTFLAAAAAFLRLPVLLLPMRLLLLGPVLCLQGLTLVLREQPQVLCVLLHAVLACLGLGSLAPLVGGMQEHGALLVQLLEEDLLRNEWRRVVGGGDVACCGRRGCVCAWWLG